MTATEASSLNAIILKSWATMTFGCEFQPLSPTTASPAPLKFLGFIDIPYSYGAGFQLHASLLNTYAATKYTIVDVAIEGAKKKESNNSHRNSLLR